MLEAWAKLVTTGKDSEPTGAKIAPLGYDIDLERQKFEFEKLRFQLAQDEKVEREKRGAERKKREAEKSGVRKTRSSARIDTTIGYLMWQSIRSPMTFRVQDASSQRIFDAFNTINVLR